MRQPSSPSTLPSFASRSPYASFFDLQNVFQCGCASDVVRYPSEQEQQQREQKEEEEQQHPQHLGYDDAFVEYDDDSSSSLLDGGEAGTESAREYFDRISKQLATATATNEGGGGGGVVKTVFRQRTTRTEENSGSREEQQQQQQQQPSIKHSPSDSTQSTTAMSFDDELSEGGGDGSEQHAGETDSGDAAKPAVAVVSILRRKEKLAGVTIRATGASVRFCPETTDFAETGTKRRPQRTRKPSHPRIRVVRPYGDDDEYYCNNNNNNNTDEARRMERRAKQNQHHQHQHYNNYHPYITHESRSPSSDFLYQSESFYVFR